MQYVRYVADRSCSLANPQCLSVLCFIARPRDGRSGVRAILILDPFGYHLVGCKIGTNAIRLHDEVVVVVAKLFTSLRVDAIVEPMRPFADAAED